MSGIARKIIPDPRSSLLDRHLPGTSQVQRLLRREGKAIIEQGQRTDLDDQDDDYERYGLYFAAPIGYIIRVDGSQKPLYYGEIKVVKATGEYHAIPRTSPRRTV
jgi:hypothetical protein